MPALENGHPYPGDPYIRSHLLGCDKCGWNLLLDGVATNPFCPDCGNRLYVYSGTKQEIDGKIKIMNSLKEIK